MGSFLFLSSNLQRQPLCKRYLLVQINSQQVSVRGSASTTHMTVLWALGVLRDDQSELVGCWVAPEPELWNWNSVRGELVSRGVERIDFLTEAVTNVPKWCVGPGMAPSEGLRLWSADGERQIDAERCNRVGFPPSGSSISSAISPRVGTPRTPTEFRLAAEVAQRVTDNLKSGLERAVRQHGTFDSKESALQFSERVLRRLEQRLGPTAHVPLNGEGHRGHGALLELSVRHAVL